MYLCNIQSSLSLLVPNAQVHVDDGADWMSIIPMMMNLCQGRLLKVM